MRSHIHVLTLCALGYLCGCATSGGRTPAPMPIEFGQDRYVSNAYLSETPGVRCGHPAFAPGGLEVRAPLPDGTWFRVVTVGATVDQLDTIVLERGFGDGEAQLRMRLDAVEGIVRLDDGGRREAWGIHHAWADWLRTLGRRVAGLDCAKAE